MPTWTSTFQRNFLAFGWNVHQDSAESIMREPHCDAATYSHILEELERLTVGIDTEFSTSSSQSKEVPLEKHNYDTSVGGSTIMQDSSAEYSMGGVCLDPIVKDPDMDFTRDYNAYHSIHAGEEFSDGSSSATELSCEKIAVLTKAKPPREEKSALDVEMTNDGKNVLTGITQNADADSWRTHLTDHPQFCSAASITEESKDELDSPGIYESIKTDNLLSGNSSNLGSVEDCDLVISPNHTNCDAPVRTDVDANHSGSALTNLEKGGGTKGVARDVSGRRAQLNPRNPCIDKKIAAIYGLMNSQLRTNGSNSFEDLLIRPLSQERVMSQSAFDPEPEESMQVPSSLEYLRHRCLVEKNRMLFTGGSTDNKSIMQQSKENENIILLLKKIYDKLIVIEQNHSQLEHGVYQKIDKLMTQNERLRQFVCSSL